MALTGWRRRPPSGWPAAFSRQRSYTVEAIRNCWHKACLLWGKPGCMSEVEMPTMAQQHPCPPVAGVGATVVSCSSRWGNCGREWGGIWCTESLCCINFVRHRWDQRMTRGRGCRQVRVSAAPCTMSSLAHIVQPTLCVPHNLSIAASRGYTVAALPLPGAGPWCVLHGCSQGTPNAGSVRYEPQSTQKHTATPQDLDSQATGNDRSACWRRQIPQCAYRHHSKPRVRNNAHEVESVGCAAMARTSRHPIRSEHCLPVPYQLHLPTILLLSSSEYRETGHRERTHV